MDQDYIGKRNIFLKALFKKEESDKGWNSSFIVHKGVDKCLIHNPAKYYNGKQAVIRLISKPGQLSL